MFLWRFAGHYFAFVTDRVLDYGFPPSATEPEPDRMIADLWLSWVFPLFATVVIQCGVNPRECAGGGIDRERRQDRRLNRG
jgi:hypothetical protein